MRIAHLVYGEILAPVVRSQTLPLYLEAFSCATR